MLRVVLFVGFLEHPPLGDGGVVHQDVEAAEGLERFVEQRLDLRRVGQVGVDPDGFAAGGADGAHDLVGGIAVARIVDGHLGAVGGEAHGDGGTNPAGGAGDEGDLVGETTHRLFLAGAMPASRSAVGANLVFAPSRPWQRAKTSFAPTTTGTHAR